MEQYIPKSVLVAEIERLADIIRQGLLSDESRMGIEIFEERLISVLDTLEVKEVDLDKETTHYLLYEHCSPLNEIMHKADLKSEMQYHKDIENAFKAGFGLGIAVSNKVQKGE